MRPNLTVSCLQCGIEGRPIARTVPFCSSRCRVVAAGRGVFIPADAERFAAKTTRDGDCLVFTGDLNHAGYGAFYVGRFSVRAHRFSWTMVNGPIPPGLDVSHRCHRRACVEVKHLYLAPHRENMAHSARDGRMATGARHGRSTTPTVWPRGESIPGSKLTAADVVEIRRCHQPRKRGAGVVVLARRFGVSRETVRAIINGKTWTHVS